MKTKIYKFFPVFKTTVKYHLVLLVIAMFFSAHTSAQAPQRFNYQAVVRNASGAIVPNQHVNARFTVRENSLTGNVSYQEIDSLITTPAGIITVVIGAGNIVSGSLNNMTWVAGNKYLQVEIDVTGGSNYVDMGTTQLISVPYAQYANTAGSLILGDDSTALITGNTTITVNPAKPYIEVASIVTPSSATLSLSNGTISGQCIVILGTSMGSTNGVQVVNGGNINIGTSGGNLPIQNGSTLMLMWSGTQWVKMAYSQNN